MVFNHEQDSMGGALGVSPEKIKRLQAYATFYMIQSQMLRHMLYDDDDEKIPSNLSSKSGVLENIFGHCDSQAERVCATWDYCSLDIKIRQNIEDDNDMSTKMFVAMISMKIKEFDMDEEVFCDWFCENINKEA
jgi:hypothetical protein